MIKSIKNFTIYANEIVRNKWEKVINRCELKSQKLAVSEFDNAVILPAKVDDTAASLMGREFLGGVGIIDNNSSIPKFIEKSGFNRKEKVRGELGVGGSYAIDLVNTPVCDDSVIWGGVLMGHFGHFILECLSNRLWYVLQHPADKRKIAFIVSHTERKKWFDDFFLLLGIDLNRILYVEQPTIFSHVTIPDQSVHSVSGIAYEEYFVTFEKIIHNIKQNKNNVQNIIKKIYLTRTNIKEEGVNIIGEEYFEEFYKNQGFHVVSPETLTIEQQIFLVSNADEVACTMGTLAHFMMFMKPNSQIHILFREPDASVIPGICMHINICPIRTLIVDVSQSIFPNNRVRGVYLLGVTKDFCEYAKAVHSVDIEPYISQTLFYEYCVEWIKLYSKKNIKKSTRLRSTVLKATNIVWLSRLSRVLLNQPYLQSDMDEMLLLEDAIKTKSEDEKSHTQKLNEKYKFMSTLILKQNSSSLILDLHISKIGWVDELYAHNKTNNGSSNQIEALRIHSQGNLQFEYCTEYAGNWGEKVKTGAISGTVGKSTAITGFALYLDEKSIQQYTIFYRLADKNGKWSDWTADGQKVSIGSPVFDIAFKVVRK